MGHSAIMSVKITGNSDDAVKAFQKATPKRPLSATSWAARPSRALPPYGTR